jgi:hypothetical protein
MNINFLEFENATKAWEGINKWLLSKETEILENGGAIYGPELISYNNFIRIKNMKVDPEFDFGMTLSYKDKKWSSLVNNYVHFDYLDQIKSEITIREKKKARSYNYGYRFNNHHGGGKDCLLSLNFTKRVNVDYPIVVFETRVSEVTQRLIFDFLLVQRMIEYIYGTEKRVEVHFIAPSMFITAERMMSFNNVKPIRNILKKHIKAKTLGSFQKKVLKSYKKYSTTDPMEFQFRSFRRAAESVQKDENGILLSKPRPLPASSLTLFKSKQDFPDNVITPTQRNAYRREQAKVIKAQNLKEAEEVKVKVLKKKKKKK